MIKDNIEYVTLQNINPTRKVKFTDSGLKLHRENPDYKYKEFFLTYDSGYGKDDPWWGITSKEGGQGELGCRIGDNIGAGSDYARYCSAIDGKIYDLYYVEAFDIEETIKNLDKLENKLKQK